MAIVTSQVMEYTSVMRRNTAHPTRPYRKRKKSPAVTPCGSNLRMRNASGANKSKPNDAEA